MAPGRWNHVPAKRMATRLSHKLGKPIQVPPQTWQVDILVKCRDAVAVYKFEPKQATDESRDLIGFRTPEVDLPSGRAGTGARARGRGRGRGRERACVRACVRRVEPEGTGGTKRGIR